MAHSDESHPSLEQGDAATKEMVNKNKPHLADVPPQDVQSVLADALGVTCAPATAHVPAEKQKTQSSVAHIGQGEKTQRSDNPFTMEEGGDMTDSKRHEDITDCADLRMVEALLFAATEPLDANTLQARLPDGEQLDATLNALQMHYEKRGINLRKINNKWQFITAKDLSFLLEKERVQPRKLSKAVLETLAIVAYHQPCSRAEIEEIRGVSVSRGTLDTLLKIGWVRLRGRRDTVPGRPMLYGTTQHFLEHFDLASISHLPGMADLKAAGLLDARLPPDFVVPLPTEHEIAFNEDADDTAIADGTFIQDFLEEDTMNQDE